MTCDLANSGLWACERGSLLGRIGAEMDDLVVDRRSHRELGNRKRVLVGVG